jgi:hypothetical protein
MVSIGIELNSQEYKKTSLGVRFLHNTRTLKTNNSIFSKEYNFTKSLIDLKNLDEVNEYFLNEEEELKKFVKEKLKQKSQNKFHIIDSLISISDDDEINTLTLEEQKKLLIKKTEDYISHLKNEGIKIYQYSLHFDEGHLNENEEIKINRHIHIIHSNIMGNGKSFTKSLYEKNKGISKIQDLISKTFQMKRGEVESKNKHQGYKNYKRNKQQEKENNIKDELKLNTLKKENQELKKKIEILEKENQKLKDENIDFKNLLNEKDLKISTLEKTLKNMYSKLNKEEIKNKYKTTKEQITQSNLPNNTKKEIHKINKKTYEEYNSPSLSFSFLKI